MKFNQMVPSQYSEYKKFFKNQRYPLCGYALSSIIAWSSEAYQPYGAVHGDALIVKAEFTTETHNRHMILPISPERAFSPEELRDLAKQNGIERYWFVPESYIKEFGKERVEKYFEVTDHDEYSDYVYRTEDLAGLKGNRYSKKRNLIHQFEQQVVEKRRLEVAPITPSSVAECLGFLEKWCAERGCGSSDEDGLACEKQALINTIENMAVMEVTGILLRIDNEVCAMAMAAHLVEEMGVLQYQKAYAGIKGLYQYFDRECARRLFDGYRYINKESDMGIPGIAKVKKSYHPIMRITAYKLELL